MEPPFYFAARLVTVRLASRRESNQLIEVPLSLDIEKAAKMLTLERGDFFATDPFVIDNFLKNVEEAIFKKHPHCCGGIKPMYIGFSKKSKHLAEINNPDYNKNLPLSLKNFSTLIAKDSTAYRFGEAVRGLVKRYQYK